MGAITDDAHGSEPVLHFRDGIPGFPGARRFVLADLGEGEGAPLQLLRSLDDPALEMVVAVPWLFFPDYAPELTRSTGASSSSRSPRTRWCSVP